MYFFISGIRLLGNFFLYDLLLEVPIRNTLYHVCTGFAATCFFLLQGLWVIVVVYYTGSILGKNLQKKCNFSTLKNCRLFKKETLFFPSISRSLFFELLNFAYEIGILIFLFIFSSLFICVCVQ